MPTNIHGRCHAPGWCTAAVTVQYGKAGGGLLGGGSARDPVYNTVMYDPGAPVHCRLGAKGALRRSRTYRWERVGCCWVTRAC